MIAALLTALALGTPPTIKESEPQLCRTVHGRLSAGNGTPGLRIWVIGTRRMLGVLPDDLGLDHLPGNIRRLWIGRDSKLFERSIYGDFRVCAWEPQRDGRMQMVRIVGGENLVAGPYR